MFVQNPEFVSNKSVNKKIISHYIHNNQPLIIKNFGERWKATELWTLPYLQNKLKNIRVPVYNNTKSNAYTPINTADDYMFFDQYIEQIIKNPEHKWRLFLFNIYTQAPELLKDIDYPTELISPIVKKAPMLFIGGKGSITHMHFDIDFSTVLHVQIYGRKKFLLFPFHQQKLIYRKPFEVLAWPDFSNYSERMNELENEFPKIKEAKGYELVLEPGDALIMPPGYWHHIEYLENSIALSMRAVNQGLNDILKGLWFLTGMRWTDTLMKKTFPKEWNNYKVNITPSFDDNLKRKFSIHYNTSQVTNPS